MNAPFVLVEDLRLGQSTNSVISQTKGINRAKMFFYQIIQFRYMGKQVVNIFFVSADRLHFQSRETLHS